LWHNSRAHRTLFDFAVIFDQIVKPDSKLADISTGAINEPLLHAFMLQLGFTPITKESGLRQFQRRGWVLVDATYEPVNALSDAARDEVIARDYPLLHDDLTELMPDRSIPLVLITANVCRILEPKLAAGGFHVLNGGRVIYFPSTGQQKKFGPVSPKKNP
jgi:hypothetical protein